MKFRFYSICYLGAVSYFLEKWQVRCDHNVDIIVCITYHNVKFNDSISRSLRNETYKQTGMLPPHLVLFFVFHIVNA